MPPKDVLRRTSPDRKNAAYGFKGALQSHPTGTPEYLPKSSFPETQTSCNISATTARTDGTKAAALKRKRIRKTVSPSLPALTAGTLRHGTSGTD